MELAHEGCNVRRGAPYQVAVKVIWLLELQLACVEGSTVPQQWLCIYTSRFLGVLATNLTVSSRGLGGVYEMKYFQLQPMFTVCSMMSWRLIDRLAMEPGPSMSRTPLGLVKKSLDLFIFASCYPDHLPGPISANSTTQD